MEDKVRKEIENWPNYKKEAYNKEFATSAHAVKLEIEKNTCNNCGNSSFGVCEKCLVSYEDGKVNGIPTHWKPKEDKLRTYMQTLIDKYGLEEAMRLSLDYRRRPRIRNTFEMKRILMDIIGDLNDIIEEINNGKSM